MTNETKIIWTIGHSTRKLEEFLSLLIVYKTELLVDVRAFPGSKRYPHFNKESLEVSLKNSAIDYHHMPALGGRRKANADSINTAWRHPAFRGYADYMQTEQFNSEIAVLEILASKTRTAFMCSEALWWKCHRALISDYLKIRGWQVLHIMEKAKITEHPFTSAVRTDQGKLFYN